MNHPFGHYPIQQDEKSFIEILESLTNLLATRAIEDPAMFGLDEDTAKELFGGFRHLVWIHNDLYDRMSSNPKRTMIALCDYLESQTIAVELRTARNVIGHLNSIVHILQTNRNVQEFIRCINHIQLGEIGFPTVIPYLLYITQRVPLYISLLHAFAYSSALDDPLGIRVTKTLHQLAPVQVEFETISNDLDCCLRLRVIESMISELPHTIMRPGRVLVLHDNLIMRVGRIRKKDKKRAIFLFSDMIMWCAIKEPDEDGGSSPDRMGYGEDSVSEVGMDIIGGNGYRPYKYKGHVFLEEDDFVFRTLRDNRGGFEFGTRRVRRVTCSPQEQREWFDAYHQCAKSNPDTVYSDLKWWVSTEIVDKCANFLSDITSWNRDTSFAKILEYNSNLLRAATSVFATPFLIHLSPMSKITSYHSASGSVSVSRLPSIPMDDEKMDTYSRHESMYGSPHRFTDERNHTRQVSGNLLVPPTPVANPLGHGLPPPPHGMSMLYSPRGFNATPKRERIEIRQTPRKRGSNLSRSIVNLMQNTSDFVDTLRDDISVASLPAPIFHEPIPLNPRSVSAEGTQTTHSDDESVNPRKRRGHHRTGSSSSLKRSRTFSPLKHREIRATPNTAVALQPLTPSSSRIAPNIFYDYDSSTTTPRSLQTPGYETPFHTRTEGGSRASFSFSMTKKQLDLVEKNTKLLEENQKLKENNDHLQHLLAKLQRKLERAEGVQRDFSISPLQGGQNRLGFELPRPIEDLPPRNNPSISTLSTSGNDYVEGSMISIGSFGSSARSSHIDLTINPPTPPPPPPRRRRTNKSPPRRHQTRSLSPGKQSSGEEKTEEEDVRSPNRRPRRPPPPPPMALLRRKRSPVRPIFISKGFIDDAENSNGEMSSGNSNIGEMAFDGNSQVVDDPRFWEHELDKYANFVVSGMSSRRSLDGKIKPRHPGGSRESYSTTDDDDDQVMYSFEA